jgi:hypothetical protein
MGLFDEGASMMVIISWKFGTVKEGVLRPLNASNFGNFPIKKRLVVPP